MSDTKSPRSRRAPAVPAEHWFRSSDDVRTGFASGNGFELKPVRYSVVGGLAMFEGDIVLGTVEQVERAAGAAADPQSIPLSGVAITGDRFRWPGAIIPYVIDPALSNPQRVTEAMAEWAARTPLRFVSRQASNTAHANYVSFEELDGCWSEVGMRGGKQVVSLAPSCSKGSAIHEIGHVAGLWHEHSREDRDQHVRVLWENIQDGREHNFDQHVTDGDDLGGYDYGSIMHYPALAFSRNGQPTIVPRNGDAIGQRVTISDTDAEAITAMYSGLTAPGPAAPQRGDRGSERLGTIGPGEVKRWATQDWPAEQQVHWSVVPSPNTSRVSWHVEVERQSGVLVRYVLEVRNLTGSEAFVDARFTVL